MIRLDDLAAWTRLGRSRLESLVASGHLAAPGVGGWEPVAVLPAIFDLFRAGMAIPAGREEQAGKIAAQRELAEIEVRRARGSLVPVEDADAALGRLAQEVRDKLLAAPQRFGLPKEPFEQLLVELATGKDVDGSAG